MILRFLATILAMIIFPLISAIHSAQAPSAQNFAVFKTKTGFFPSAARNALVAVSAGKP